VAKNLASIVSHSLGLLGYADLEKAFHGLQTTDGSEIDAILERTHRNERTRKDAFPVLEQAICCCRHVERQSLYCSSMTSVDVGREIGPFFVMRKKRG
jgi:hypothetical protein